MDQPVRIQTHSVKRDKLDLLYPAVAHLNPYSAQHAINTAIVHTVNQMLHDQGYPQNPMTDVSAYYEFKTNERHILSLSFVNYAFSGGAHGLTIQKSLTFSTETGQVYALKDLFKPGSNYVARLTAIIGAQIKARNIPLLVNFTAIRPDQD